MFGGKLKSWMETHIGRQKKKPGAKEKKKSGKVLVESSESLAQSDTGISSGSLQVLSSITDGQDSYCTTTIESDNRELSQRRAVNLSSPESAYSTGYSTDGASPGDATQPHPEYYINIRSGKHYFPSPAPTPTSPNPHPRACITTSFLSAEPRIPPLQTFPSWLTEQPEFTPIPNQTKCDTSLKCLKKAPPKSPLNSLKLFLKSPKQDKVKPKNEGGKALPPEIKKSPGNKNRKWYKQAFKFNHKSSESDSKVDDHRDELDIIPSANPDEIYGHEKGPVLLSCEPASSPRQRNRIRTNPWIATEPFSINNFQKLQLTFPPGLRNRSCTNTPLQQRKTPDEPPLQDKLHDMTMQYETSRDYLTTLEQTVNSHLGKAFLVEVSDHSEEDLTLNEMMGTYNESYVYEKETDILSDSDPTDCEDYVSDSEAIHGGDEDSHDDELDFIDTGSLVESEEIRANTGRCSYHETPISRNSFLCKNRCQSSLDAQNKRNSRKEKEAKKRKREEKKRKSVRRLESVDSGAKKLDNSGEVSLRNVLLKRILDKNCSRSAESSPKGIRRKQLVTDLRETHIGSFNNKNYVNKNNFDMTFLTDAEADKRYNELIQEAESMLESLKNTPVADRRMPFEAKVTPKQSPRRRQSPKNGSPKFESRRETPRRSPKNLGLKLSVGAEMSKKCDESDKKTSFRAKSSAHSPLDPLGPTFRNFSIFKESSPIKKISSSSSDELETLPVPFRSESPVLTPPVQFGFQFVDLGGKSEALHCPQSEPVKRKMYSCSKTFDLLVKTFDSPRSPRPRRTAPAFYNPLYSPVPHVRGASLPTSQLGRRLSEHMN